MEEQREEEKMDARERMEMRHTVTVGMSWHEISKQKALENLWREMKLIGLTIKNEHKKVK